MITFVTLRVVYAKRGIFVSRRISTAVELQQTLKKPPRLCKSLDLNDGLEIIRKSIQETERVYGQQQDRHYRLLHGRHIRPTVSLPICPSCQQRLLSMETFPEENVLKKIESADAIHRANKDGGVITPQKVESLRQIAQKYNLPVEIVTYDATTLSS